MTASDPFFADDKLDFSLLASSDDYGRYFRCLSKACQLLYNSYAFLRSEQTFEAKRLAVFLERLRFSVYALQLKYAYHPAHRRKMWVDLSDSGFPNAQEFNLLGVDLLKRQQRLKELPVASLLRQRLLDHMFKHHEDAPDILWQLSERSYLESLHEDACYLPFTMTDDDLHRLPSDQKQLYECAWACYDPRQHLPFVHVMSFEQAVEATPLEEKQVNYEDFLEVLQAEGSRVPDLGILAMALDDSLEAIYPKILKRIGIGPLYSLVILQHEEVNHDARQDMLKMLLERYATEDDVILFVRDEIIFSKRQRLTKSLFSAKATVRQIFHIPENEPESYRRRASVVHQQVLLPHSVAQHLDDEVLRVIPEFRSARLLTYNRRGEVYGR